MHHAKHRIEGLKLCDCCHPEGKKNRRRKVRAWLRKRKAQELKEQIELLQKCCQSYLCPDL